jgi:repressor LexA
MNNLGNKETMAENIKYYLDLHNKDRGDLCRDLGFKYTTVSNWLQGTKYPRIDKIEMMARYFGITKADLVEKRVPLSSKPVLIETYRIPVLGKVAAGTPIEACEDVIGYEYLADKYKTDGCNYFALRIQGHSMEPTIMDGDNVIVRQQPTVDSGDIAIVLINGDTATAKEVRETPDGITLVGHNVAVYSPHPYTRQEIINLPVTILGKGIEVRRHLG